MSLSTKCSNPDCAQESKFKCPICINLGIVQNSLFCSEECFKSFWPLHKLLHSNKEAGSEAGPGDQLPKAFKNFKFTGPLRPGTVTPMVKTPQNVSRPDYAISGIPKSEIHHQKTFSIPRVTKPEDLAALRECALLARQALDLGHSHVRPGITTNEINDIVHKFIVERDGYPSPLNYHGFPKSLCTSVNEVICHGIPDSRPLENGDIVNLDVTVFYKGFHADLNETYCVGEVSAAAKDLIRAAYRSLEAAIAICKPGVMYKKVGAKIQEVISETPYSIVRSYCGHGVGRLFHCAPNVSHYANSKDVGIMEKGHVFTIEPMINEGDWKDVTWPDEWTAVTKDGKLSAQFEHTLLITDDGCEVLTRRLPDSPPLEFDAPVAAPAPANVTPA